MRNSNVDAPNGKHQNPALNAVTAGCSPNTLLRLTKAVTLTTSLLSLVRRPANLISTDTCPAAKHDDGNDQQNSLPGNHPPQFAYARGRSGGSAGSPHSFGAAQTWRQTADRI